MRVSPVVAFLVGIVVGAMVVSSIRPAAPPALLQQHEAHEQRSLVPAAKVGAAVGLPDSPALFPPRQDEYTCVAGGNLLTVALRQPFITADPSPIRYKMHAFPPQDDVWVSASIYPDEGNQMFEMPLKQRIYEALRATLGLYKRPTDPIFMDVGANVGVHSLFVAAMKVRTHSFEPMPRNLDMLKCSVAANPGMAKYIALNGFGLSDKNSDGACMNVESQNQGNAFFVPDKTGCVSDGIKLRTLDGYWWHVLKQEHVFLMKMDVQGFEGFVIKGGSTMLREKPPLFLFMEYSPSRYREYGMDPAQVLQDLIAVGYSIKKFDSGQDITADNGMIQELAGSPGGWECDLELTHDATLKKYQNGEIKF